VRDHLATLIASRLAVESPQKGSPPAA
jgi:hypothetical protein